MKPYTKLSNMFKQADKWQRFCYVSLIVYTVTILIVGFHSNTKIFVIRLYNDKFAKIEKLQENDELLPKDTIGFTEMFINQYDTDTGGNEIQMKLRMNKVYSLTTGMAADKIQKTITDEELKKIQAKGILGTSFEFTNMKTEVDPKNSDQIYIDAEYIKTNVLSDYSMKKTKIKQKFLLTKVDRLEFLKNNLAEPSVYGVLIKDFKVESEELVQ